MNKFKRGRLYVVPRVQSRLIGRVIIYWGSCWAFVIIPLMLARIWSDPSRLYYEHLPFLWREYGIVALLSLFVLPLVMYDMLKYSNRVVGPLYQMCNEMNALAAGDVVRRVHFREEDEWHDLAEAFNHVADELSEARRALDTKGTDSVDQDATSSPKIFSP